MIRKNALLTILSVSLLLCGCNQSSGGGGKKKSSSTNPGESSQQTLTTTGETTTGGQSTTSTTTLPAGEYKVYTCGEALPFDSYGINISDLNSEQGNRDTLMNSLNTQARSNIVNSISASNCHIQTDDDSSVKSHFHLSVGSGSNSGYIQLNFSQILKKVVVEASGYYKHYSDGYSVDTDAKIIINGIEYNFTTLDKEPNPDVETFTVEYSEGVNYLRFANDDEDQRFYLDSIHLFF